MSPLESLAQVRYRGSVLQPSIRSPKSNHPILIGLTAVLLGSGMPSLAAAPNMPRSSAAPRNSSSPVSKPASKPAAPTRKGKAVRIQKSPDEPDSPGPDLPDPTSTVPFANTPVAPQGVNEEALHEGLKVKWLFPGTIHASVVEDKTFRLLVKSDGTVFDSETEHLYRLTRGAVLLSPSKTITVHTPNAEIVLHDHSVVTIDATPNFTRILDFHDKWKGHVVVKTEGHSNPLFPGHEFIVVNETDEAKAFKHVLQVPLRRRDMRPVYTTEKLIAYAGDFSVPDAMLKSELFRCIREKNDGAVKDVIEDVTKTAALLHMTDTRGPYIFLTP